MDKSKKVLILSSIVLVGFVLAVIFHYVLGFYLNKAYPFNTFLWQPGIAFGDFTEMLPLIKALAPFKAHNYWLNYFPLSFLILFPFTYIKHVTFSYIIFASVFIGFFVYLNKKYFNCEQLSKVENFQNILILTSLSYPFLSLIDRGNFDMVLFVLFAFFVISFKSEKYLLSSILLAIANSIKPFTLMFLILFLLKKKYKEFIVNIIITILLIIGGFMLLKGNIFDQISVFILNVADFNYRYVYSTKSWGMGNNSSLYMCLKMLFCMNNSSFHISTFLLANIYKYVSAFFTIITVFFAWKEKIFWKQITLMTLYMLLIPPVITDYKLIFLFVPIYLFVNAKKEEATRSDLIYLIFFALLLIPKHYFIVDLLDNMNKFSVSAILNPTIMLLFMGQIIFEQIKAKKEI